MDRRPEAPVDGNRDVYNPKAFRNYNAGTVAPTRRSIGLLSWLGRVGVFAVVFLLMSLFVGGAHVRFASLMPESILEVKPGYNHALDRPVQGLREQVAVPPVEPAAETSPEPVSLEVPAPRVPQTSYLDVPASPGGYVTLGAVNGVPLSFLVDTGASRLVLPWDVARRAGIPCERQVESSTANGRAVGCEGHVAELKFGPFVVRNVDVTILPNAFSGLLGMAVLRQFTMTWRGDSVRIVAIDRSQLSENPLPVPAPFASMPKTGALRWLRSDPPGAPYAPLRVVGNRLGMNCLFHLDEWSTGIPVLDIFVRTGEVAESSVALGRYRGKIVCGYSWFGDQLFGPGQVLSELTTPVVFSYSATGGLQGMVISLSPAEGGNLHSRSVNP